MVDLTKNCAVRAIHYITGEEPQDIVDGIASFRHEDGGPAFVGDGVWVPAVCSYLESRGWRVQYFEERLPIPWTAILCIPGHCFAIVEGRIYDAAPSVCDGVLIDTIISPPNGTAPKWATA